MSTVDVVAQRIFVVAVSLFAWIVIGFFTRFLFALFRLGWDLGGRFWT